MDNLISSNITKVRGHIARPSSSSKVQMKIDHQPRVDSSVWTQSAISRTDQNSYGKASFDAVLNSRVEGQAEAEKETGQWTEYTIKAGDTIWDLAVKRYHVNVDDVIRDNNIKDPRKIQPGDKIRIRIPSYPSAQEVTASWYGADYHGKAMANGDFYNMYAPTIAHKDLPLGTRVELENKETGVKVQAVVTDRGPFIAGRDIDLSYGLAKVLSLEKKGVGKLTMRVLG
jgi:rare lipoprotein A (peptidoglycan hydrolase)